MNSKVNLDKKVNNLDNSAKTYIMGKGAPGKEKLKKIKNKKYSMESITNRLE